MRQGLYIARSLMHATQIQSRWAKLTGSQSMITNTQIITRYCRPRSKRRELQDMLMYEFRNVYHCAYSLRNWWKQSIKIILRCCSGSSDILTSITMDHPMMQSIVGKALSYTLLEAGITWDLVSVQYRLSLHLCKGLQQQIKTKVWVQQ